MSADRFNQTDFDANISNNTSTTRIINQTVPNINSSKENSAEVKNFISNIIEILDIREYPSLNVLLLANPPSLTLTKFKKTQINNKLKQKYAAEPQRLQQLDNYLKNLENQQTNTDRLYLIIGHLIDPPKLTTSLNQTTDAIRSKSSVTSTTSNKVISSSLPSSGPVPNIASAINTNPNNRITTKTLTNQATLTSNQSSNKPLNSTIINGTSSTISRTAPHSGVSTTTSSPVKSAALNTASVRSSLGVNQEKLQANSIPAEQPAVEHSIVPLTQPIIRAAEDADLIDLVYGCRIVLRCFTGKYIAADEGRVSGNAANAHSFAILNAKQLNDRTSAVRFQDTVCLVNSDGDFLAFSPTSGEVSMMKPPQTSSAVPVDIHFRWQMISAHPHLLRDNLNYSARAVVKIFDTISLRSVVNNSFLSSAESGELAVNAREITNYQTIQLAKANLPIVPDWARKRISQLNFSSLDLVSLGQNGAESSKIMGNFNKLAPEVQEQYLLEDLLFVLMGIEGKYIKLIRNIESGRVEFQPNSAITNKSNVDLLRKILPLAEYYYTINNYCEVHSRYEYGLVQHSLTKAIQQLLKEYLVLIAQLEHQFNKKQLTLLRLWFYLQPSVATMKRLFDLTSRCAHSTGGQLLSILHNCIIAEGDSNSKSLYSFLANLASFPYYNMLELWLSQGIIRDLYEEFQIKSREELNKENVRVDFNDTYWDERYSTRNDKLPSFLASLAEKILITGKYLNVIRECGKEIQVSQRNSTENGEINSFSYESNEKVYYQHVEDAYNYASNLLLTMLLQENQLLARLASVKRYFLFQQGDFYSHFIDIAEEELLKPVTEINPIKLKSLLELALRTSKAQSDPFYEDLSCYLQPHTLLQKLEAIHSQTKGNGVMDNEDAAMSGNSNAVLKGMESFTLSYRVNWPLSLILSKKSLTKYQLIFRQIFSCKHVERLLVNCWRNQHVIKELNIGNSFHSSFNLRHRMLHFIENYLYYLLHDIIENNYKELQEEINKVTTVDELIKQHNLFLDKTLRQSLLTNQQLLKILAKIMTTSSLFADAIDRFTQSMKIQSINNQFNSSSDREELREGNHERTASMFAAAADQARINLHSRASRITAESAHVVAVSKSPDYMSLITGFTSTFDSHLSSFFFLCKEKSTGHYDQHLANLLIRLDYNNYYSNTHSTN
jgi:gamma-tubulin complex component 2